VALRRLLRLVVPCLVVAAVAVALPAAGAATNPAGRLSGRVQDSVSGTALAGAGIALSDPASHAVVASGSADASGAYSVAAPQGIYDVTVNATNGAAPEQGLMRGVAVKADSHLMIALAAPAPDPAPGVSLTGTVADRNHTGLASVALTLYSQATSYINTTSAADGSFSVRVPAGHYVLTLHSGGPNAGAVVPQQSFDLAVADVDLSANRRLDLVLAAVDMKVTVRDRTGAVVPNTHVTAYGGFNNGTQDRTFTVAPGVAASTSQWSWNGKTDASGAIAMVGFPTDAVRFSVTPPTGPYFNQAGFSLPAAGSLDITFPSTATVRGVVHDYDGAPLPGLSVGLFSADMSYLPSTISGADGSYALTVPTGSYSLSLARTFSPDGRGRNDTYSISTDAFSVAVSADRVIDLTMPVRPVTVHITAPSGAPVSGARVQASDDVYNSTPGQNELFPGAPGRGWRASNRTTDSNGDAQLLVLPGGPVTVNAYAPDGSPLAQARTATVAANDAGSVTLALRSTVAVTGHATVGTPRAGVSVSLTDGATQFGATTAADGSYTLRVPPSTYDLVSIGAATGSLSGGPLTVTADRTLDIAPPTALVTARAYDAAGALRPFDSLNYYAMAAGPTVDAPLASGLAASSAYANTTVSSAGATKATITAIEGVNASISFSSGDAAGTAVASAGALRFSTDTDLAIVQATAGGSNPPPTPTTTTTTTTAPGSTGNDPGGDGAQTSGTPAGTTPGATTSTRSGYWMVSADGEVHAFGDAVHYGDPHGTLGRARAVHLEPTPDGKGYWILDDAGRIHPFGDAAALGDATTTALAAGEKAASLSATPTGAGYWIFTNRGRVLTFGDATFYGDMSKTRLNGAVLGSVATPSGKGYYMVASDGGIFTFGDAAFHGSTGNLHLNQPVMGMAAGPGGYWLVASDGGIFAFDVPFHGSMGAAHLNKPISGLVPGHDGYLMVASDGGIFAFGDVAFHGSLGAQPPATPVVGAALLP
jgi:hypothetical protein